MTNTYLKFLSQLQVNDSYLAIRKHLSKTDKQTNTRLSCMFIFNAIKEHTILWKPEKSVKVLSNKTEENN